MSTKTFSSKFGIGDTAYDVREIKRDFKAKCALCSSAGKVAIAGSDRRAECPDCYGNGWVWDAEDKHNECRALTIGEVRITAGRSGRKVQYMCEETGVGSGTLHNETSLFATKEEAQAECVRRDGLLTRSESAA